MPLRGGETFAGYSIVRLLGTGGMGEVYLAEHPRLPRRDALKILPVEVSADPEYRARFDREADLASKLWHPHIVSVHDRGEHDGQLWISMDYVDGLDAARLLASRFPAGMPTDLVVRIVTAVAGALDYAHKQGLLHRDVKPANIMLTHLDDDDDEQRILLADFGIARNVDDISGLTTTNMTVGTVAYSAPEQLMGEVIDGRADQYALAATAYHLLTGSQLFPHSNPAVVISRHLNSPPPALADTRPDLAALDQVLAVALAKDPDDRFARCAEFARALAEHARENGSPSPGAATKPAAVPRTARPGVSHARAGGEPAQQSSAASGSRRRWLVGTAVLGVILLAGVIALAWHPWERARSTAATTISPPLPATSSTSSYAPPPPASPPITPTTTAPPPVNCGVNLDADQARAGMEMFEKSNPDFATAGVNAFDGNFSPCATLSTVLVYPYGASVSSLRQALMFHKGEYIGTATPHAYAFMKFNAAQTTDGTVVLDFAASRNSCGACDDATYQSVRFRWQGDHIEMVGTPPTLYQGG
jgi:serine/threonine-protein kinase